MPHINFCCPTWRHELARKTRKWHVLRLRLHPAFLSSGHHFYLCVCAFMCVCLCYCSGFTPGEDRQLLCGREDAGEGQPISRRATETAPVWSECQYGAGHLLPPPPPTPRWNWAIGRTHSNIHSHVRWMKLMLFQELECAVSVEEDNRQEWTFTLYDFDNSGKVTREVILHKRTYIHI